MRILFYLILTAMYQIAGAQPRKTGNKIKIEKQWITNEQYVMNWYMIRDTVKTEIGKVTTDIYTKDKQLVVVTQVNMKQMKTPWVDSTIAKLKNMKPVYHSSYNGQRDMVLRFGKPITGYYLDKQKKTNTPIADSSKGDYFDSNLYPQLIRWLPLAAGYTKELSIYDYNPNGKTGILKVSVTEVKKGSYTSPVSGNHEVWLVNVTDDISGSPSVYFIDVKTRQLWKQEISLSNRRMAMIRVE
jgi:hypothetical protein